MKSDKLALKWLLGLIFIVQFLLGVAGLLSGAVLSKVIAICYGATFTTTPQTEYIIRMMCAYLISMALLALFAFLNPERNKAIINGLIVLMLLRFFEVLIFAKRIQETFNISLGKIWFDGGVFFIVAILLFIFRPKTEA